MKTIVVSGINLFTGGTLKVMQDCIASMSALLGSEYLIIALVHDQKQHPTYENVQYIAFPKSRKSWLFRLYYEYIGFRKLSKQLKPWCWLSMHDLSPSVHAEKRMVYCHNSFPFYKAGWKAFFLQLPIYMFSVFLKHFYRINIRKNDCVIVQQEATRELFQEVYGVNKIVVSLPVGVPEQSMKEGKDGNVKKVFFYPSGPMIHKNFEVIGKAVALLEKEAVSGFEVVITINGAENRYARYLHRKFKHLKSLRFAGYLSKEEMDKAYKQCDCLLFPSKTESWGLPLSEAKELNKPILSADLPYARETVGAYDKVKFFDPDNARELALDMKNLIEEQMIYDPTRQTDYQQPFASNWNDLMCLLFPKGN